MTNLQILQQLNSLSPGLPLLEAFIGIIQGGFATINTDGNGNYWALLNQYNPDTGVLISPPVTVPLLIVPANITAAATAMAALNTLVQNATVGTMPAQ